MPDPLLRPSFPDIYMRLAGSLAERSSCGRGLRVGCVISSPDYRKILAVGYNGNAAGLPNGCDDPTAVGACGCFLAGTRVRAAGVARAYRRRYTGDVLRVVTAHGDFTVTPNHPILTPTRGWVAAELLHEGDDLLHPQGDERVALGGPYDQHDVPIEQVFETLLVAGRAVRRAGARHDFHGDGLVDEDVDVVAAAGPLGTHGEHRLLECPQEPLLLGSNAVEALLGRQGAVVGPFDPASGPSSARVSGRAPLGDEHTRLDETQLDRRPAHAVRAGEREGGRAGSVTPRDLLNGQRQHPLTLVSAQVLGDAAKHAAFAETILNEGVRHAHVPRDRYDGLAALVATHKVIHIDRKPWSGHVFNLQTANGWYVAEGTIAKNCLHAEENAVINCDVPRATPKVVFCTHLPCPMCAKRIINLGGVEDVLYLNDYRRKDSLHLFDRSSIRAGHYAYGDDGFNQAWRRAEADLRRHLINRRDNKEPT